MLSWQQLPKPLRGEVGILTPIDSEEDAEEHKEDRINRTGNLVLAAVLSRIYMPVSTMQNPQSMGVEAGSFPNNIS